MAEVLPAIVTAIAGLALLVLVVLLVLARVRRFVRASTRVRTDVTERARSLRELAGPGSRAREDVETEQ